MPQNQDREAVYDEVTDYICRRGGARLIGQRRFVRRCVGWLADAPPDFKPSPQAIRELIRGRAEQECGSVFLALMLPIILNLVSTLLYDWWKKRHGEESGEPWEVRFDAP